MAVKARDEITLTSVCDVKAIYRYYLLQASTLQMPEKPVAFPPPAPWDDVEPAYSGGTDSLYTVEATVLGDDTVIYSNVSLSSSYEAAKAAWNKADNAEEMAVSADKVHIGATAPTDTAKLWCDTSVDPPVIRRWDADRSVWVVVNDQSSTLAAIAQVRTDAYSEIDQQINNIRFTVGTETYTIEEFSQLVASQYSEFVQTKDQFVMNFNDFQTDIENLSSSTDAKFAERNSYIRFENDPTYGATIYIGKSGSPFILRMRNDRISFLQNGSEVAYISDNKMFITSAQISTSLKVGNFEWILENNGSLSLK